MKISVLLPAAAICIASAACTGATPRPDPGAAVWRIVPETAVPDDVVIVRLFDERFAPGIPGPVATPETVRRTLAARLAEGEGAGRSVAAGLPYFGYLWRSGQPPVAITLDEARHAAAEANVELTRDPVSGALHAIKPTAWELWIVDDEQLRLLRAEVASLGVKRVALFVKR